MEPWRGAVNSPLWQPMTIVDPTTIVYNYQYQPGSSSTLSVQYRPEISLNVQPVPQFAQTPRMFHMQQYVRSPPFFVQTQMMPAPNGHFTNGTFNNNAPTIFPRVQLATAQQDYSLFVPTHAYPHTPYWAAAPNVSAQIIPRSSGQHNSNVTTQHNRQMECVQTSATISHNHVQQSSHTPSQANMKGHSHHSSTSVPLNTPSNTHEGHRRHQKKESLLPVKYKEERSKLHQKNAPRYKRPTDREEIHIKMERLRMKEDNEMKMKLESYYKPNQGEQMAQKSLYTEHPDVTQLSIQEVEDIRMQQNIHIEDLIIPSFHVLETVVKPPEPQLIPKPITTFEQGFYRYPEILQEINRQGFESPTPIQCQLWPVLLSGHDAVGIAQTGSGKTLAFLLPALLHIRAQHRQPNRGKPIVLILAPTRELAIQIKEEADKIQCYQYRSVCLIGGVPKHLQLNPIRRGVEIVVATPGRLNDLVQSGDISLENVSFLVLDEADEMLDQGFEPQIHKALLKVRQDRQTVLTSATWPSDVRRMAKNYTTRPFLIHIGELELQTVSTVHQRVEVMKREEKEEWFLKFIRNNPNAKVMVFCASKPLVDHLSSEVATLGIDCESIHSGLSQEDRESSISYMKNGQSRILIASDVASRGIDIPDVTHVINYDFPRHIERYVHRVGRTGRAGNQGEAITLLSYNEKYEASLLIEVLKKSGQEIPQNLKDLAARRNESWGRRDRAPRV